MLGFGGHRMWLLVGHSLVTLELKKRVERGRRNAAPEFSSARFSFNMLLLLSPPYGLPMGQACEAGLFLTQSSIMPYVVFIV